MRSYSIRPAPSRPWFDHYFPSSILELYGDELAEVNDLPRDFIQVKPSEEIRCNHPHFGPCEVDANARMLASREWVISVHAMALVNRELVLNIVDHSLWLRGPVPLVFLHPPLGPKAQRFFPVILVAMDVSIRSRNNSVRWQVVSHKLHPLLSCTTTHLGSDWVEPQILFDASVQISKLRTVSDLFAGDYRVIDSTNLQALQ